MPRLVDLEVEEVSLVDRPATGRRFRVFKRNSRFLERLLGTDVRKSDPKEADPPMKESVASLADDRSGNASGEETVTEPEAVLKRMEEALIALSEQSEALQKRLERLESVPAARHSFDSGDSTPGSLWKGVLV